MNWIKRHKGLSAFLLVAVLLLGWRQYDRQFTPERWAETGSSHRGKLVGSLLRQYGSLEGMTRAEVEALLGEDASGGTAYEERLLPGGGSLVRSMLVYPAGRPGAAWPMYLYVYLENDRVTEAKFVAD